MAMLMAAHAGANPFGPRPSLPAAKRVPTSKLRQLWEKFWNKKWPKDEKTGKNQDACHKKALADGGDNSPKNIEPKPHDEHIKDHMDKGDFKRWGGRSGGGTE